MCARRWLAGSRFSLTIVADKIVTVQTDRVDDKSMTPELTLINHKYVTSFVVTSILVSRVFSETVDKKLFSSALRGIVEIY